MRAWLAVALVVLFLAGCNDPPAADTSGADPNEDLDYGVRATETTGVIRGFVVDSAIRPIAGVNISIVSTGASVLTADNGAFGFDGLEPGTYFLNAAKANHASIQTSVEVVAGDSEPPLVKISLQVLEGQQPFFEVFSDRAYITCGFAVVATSVGCSTFPDVGAMLGDSVYFNFEHAQLPSWTQGELIWDQTQPAGGAMIWEIVDPNYPGSPQPHTGYRETGTSPALAYINTTTLEENQAWVVGEGNGTMYRIFGGPHPMCTGVGFGCGVTYQQQMQVIVHNFYNFAPPEGWRYTANGDPQVP